MSQPAASQRLLENFLKIYKIASRYTRTWPEFWKDYLSHRPIPHPPLPEFISNQTSLLSQSLNAVGKDHPIVRKFISSLPLRLSKTILSWPTTPEMLRELMTD